MRRQVCLNRFERSANGPNPSEDAHNPEDNRGREGDGNRRREPVDARQAANDGNCGCHDGSGRSRILRALPDRIRPSQDVCEELLGGLLRIEIGRRLLGQRSIERVGETDRPVATRAAAAAEAWSVHPTRVGLAKSKGNSCRGGGQGRVPAGSARLSRWWTSSHLVGRPP